MSRNGSGIYNLPTGNPVVTGTTISSNWANTTLTDISTALTNSLASDGQTPVTGDIQMGGNKVTGLGTPTATTDGTTKAYVDAAIATATGTLGTMSTQNANNVAITGGSITGVTISSLASALPVASGGTGVTTSTGSGANVLGTSPTIASPSISGAVMSSMASSVITSGTSQASTSGTNIDFTSIPSWVKRVTVMFSGVSTSGSNQLQIVLGTSGGFVTSGYSTMAAYGGTTYQSPTSGFLIIGVLSSTDTLHGSVVLTLLTGNTWVCNGFVIELGSNRAYGSGGSIALGGTLTQTRVTTVGGTDTFDAGSINILYE